MKVRELCELLAAMPPDAEVLTEGCDCLGDAGGVTLITTTAERVGTVACVFPNADDVGRVLITRP